jgi:two-component system NtrC family response regulator
MKPSILIIDDNCSLAEGMKEILEQVGYQVKLAYSGQEGLKKVEKYFPQVVLVDYKLGDLNGIEVLRQIKKTCFSTEVIMMTAYGTIELAVEAMKLGATDFITKPFSMDEIKIKLKKITAEPDFLTKNDPLEKIIGQSKAIKEVKDLIKKVARSNSSVLIYGETGTGKELVAAALHHLSLRAGHPFIKVNCSVFASGVLESELFGHEKGAFTGAVTSKKGRFELANRGTLFLDEIGEIDKNIQLKLLRVLQERELERVGGTQPIKVDVRIVSATNQNLKKLIEQGKFREDLYYRLNVIPIHLPPLRERREDIQEISLFFLERMKKELRKKLEISDSAWPVLLNYSWPGNVRELENVIERAAVLSESGIIEARHFPLEPTTSFVPPSVSEEAEKEKILSALKQSCGNRSRAAKLLGIKRTTLLYKIQKYQLEVKK